MKVLVTGAAGSIGRVVTVGLADRGHTVVGLDRVPQPDGDDGAWYTVDCADPDAVAAVFDEEPLDAVVHLAGLPGRGQPPRLADLPRRHDRRPAGRDGRARRTPLRLRRLQPRGRPHAAQRTWSAIDVPPAARHVLRRRQGRRGGADEPLRRPLRHRRRRPAGSARSSSAPETVRNLSTWLSHDDCVRMVDAALTATAPGFAVLYGISANTRAWWDLEPGRALGYEPQDDAEEFARLDRQPAGRRGRRRRTSAGRTPPPSSSVPALDRYVLTWSALQE